MVILTKRAPLEAVSNLIFLKITRNILDYKTFVLNCNVKYSLQFGDRRNYRLNLSKFNYSLS